MRAQISAQERKIALLEADWALETSPARLEAIARQFESQLELKPLDPQQIVDTTELPALRTERNGPDDETYAESEGRIVTGGIGGLIEREGEQ